jgi:energy-coupling factor transporter ATP-binding protein EcfA2
MEVSENNQVTLRRIVDICRRGDPVLFAGLGLSIESGYPSWPTALRELSAHLSNSPSVEEAIRTQNLDVLADTIANGVPQSVIRDTLKKIYWTEHQSWSREWSPLRLLPFSSIVTPGWDQSVERAFQRGQSLEVLSPSSSTGMDALARRSCLIRLHGNLHNDNDEIIVSQEQFRSALARNPVFTRHLASFITGRSHIFVGASPRTIVEYMRLAPKPNTSSRGWHFALMADDPSLRLYADLLETCDVTVIPYAPANFGRRQLLERIAAEFGRQQKGFKVAKTREVTGRVEWIKLKNIGVFDQLEYSFESNWNVMLGNNGSGKSTILKALAFGLASSDPSVALWGKKLLARGKSNGYVEVCVAGVEYHTDIGAQAHGTHPGIASPVEIGRAFVLGYPALRGGPSENANGPMHRTEDAWSGDDITPLLTGSLDSRMGVLKQWVVNSVVRERLGPGNDTEATYSDSISRFHIKVFELLSLLLPDSDVEFDSIDETDWSIKVRHRGRIVDLDDLSQGLSSILGWAAHAFHRTNQVLGVGDRPQNPAILIVDELDAHMHPEWQQSLPTALSKMFPNDQFVVATHSPFLAIGRRSGEVKRIYQDPSSRQFTVYPVVADTSAWAAGGALTSHLFGLQSLLPKNMEKAVIQKRILSAKQILTDLDVKALREADAILKGADWAHGIGTEDLPTDVLSDAARFSSSVVSSPSEINVPENKLAVSDEEALEIVRTALSSPRDPKA